MNRNEAVALLRLGGRQANVEGMARFGIRSKIVLGIPVPALRSTGRKIRHSHRLTLQLWATGIHEARALAALIDLPEEVTPRQMERWAALFDSWATCNGCCEDLFWRTPFALAKAVEWSRRRPEFVRRAAFALIA